MASLCQIIWACYQRQIAKAMAILRGLQLVVETGLVSATLESDALSVVNTIELKVVPSAKVGVVVHDILYVLRDSNFTSVNFVPRLANNVAYSLAKLALGHECESVWLEDYPLSVESLVLFL
ncbi:hypothetical protein Dsin_030977 [Dipteronia sinensis]|uniref:RNase H type-1 domain-containing protein n=1 Tax=Dipteronia sinensis TaxID=43782 RepID=A0AAE0DRN1_9ROSI|nr:hypothetical protein Dsin_030977 [Dipteronia sinensis]